MTFSGTLDRTVQMYRANFARLLLIAGLGVLPQIPWVLMLDPQEMQRRQAAGLPVTFPPGFWVMVIVASVFAMVQHAALCKATVDTCDGKPVSLGGAYGAAFSRFLSLLGAGILMGLAVMGGMILLIIPGFYVMLGFMLTYVVIMAEGAGAVTAMKRSWALANGRRWRILGLSIVWGILHFVVSYAVGGVLGLAGLGAKFGNLGQQVAAILMGPCYGLSLGLVYYQARKEKEGLDLARDAERLAAGGAPAL